MKPIVIAQVPALKPCFPLLFLFFCAIFSVSHAQPARTGGIKFIGDNFIDCGQNSVGLFNFQAGGTICAWVKITRLPPPENSTTFFPIAAKDEGPGEKSKWIFGVQNGRLIFHVNSLTNSGAPFSNFVTIYSEHFNFKLDRYYYFAISLSGNGLANFYVDGTTAGASSLTRPVPIVGAPLYIGKAEAGFFLSGEISEVRFWDKALSADEIKGSMLLKPGVASPGDKDFIADLLLTSGHRPVAKGRNGIIPRIEVTARPFFYISPPPLWLVLAIFLLILVLLFSTILYRIRLRMNQEKMEMELFVAQMNHENNNSVGMMMNILSRQLNENGLDHLDAQLQLRLQIIADLNSTDYVMHNEKRLAFKKYIAHLVEKINQAFRQDKQITYVLDLPDKVKAGHAIKLAILIRELTLNSLKHAFEGKTTGEISISIKPANDGFFRLEFSDNGRGISSSDSVRPSVGSVIINAISSQLGASPVIICNAGYKFVLLFR